MNNTDTQKNDNKLALFFMILSLLVSSVLLFTHDPYYGHDIGFHLSRIQSIAACLKNHSFPAVIYPNYFNGFGYANGLFYPDLFLYIPGILTFLGLNIKTSYQVFLFLMNLGTWMAMYFCTNRIISHKYSSSVISCIYLLCSYRITDLYERSALGETLCFVFMPFVILGIYETLYRDPKKGFYLVFGLFGVLSSHVITLLSCVIFIFCAYFIRLIKLIRNKEELINRTKYIILWCTLSVFVCAYFLFPFLEAYVSDTYLFKTAPATGGWDRAMPFLLSFIEIPTYRNVFSPLGIGIVFLILLILFIINSSKNRKITDPERDLLILGLFFHLLSTDLFPWTMLKGLAQLIQFPWRFLIVASTVLLFAFAPTVKGLMTSSEKKKIFYTLLMIGCVGFTILCSAIEMYIIEDFRLYHDEIHYSVGGIEYMPSDVDMSLLNQPEIISNHDIHTEFKKNGTSMSITYDRNTYEDTFLEVPLIYYKGYKAFSNNKKLNVLKGNNGLVRIELNDTQGTIDLSYGSTPARTIGYLTSIISLILLVYLIRKK